MATKQLTYGDSQTPFFPTIENPITLVELNSSVMELSNSSSSEDIAQAFDGDTNFVAMLAQLRQSGTVINGITIASDLEAGNKQADIVVAKSTDEVTIRYIDNNYQYTLVITRTGENAYTCTKSQLLLGSEVDLSNYLSKTNTTSYTPSTNYNPATKKYVDDNVVWGLTISSQDGATASLSETNYNRLAECITNGQDIVVIYFNGTETNRVLVNYSVNNAGTITLECHIVSNENGDIVFYKFDITGTSFTNNVTITTNTISVNGGSAFIIPADRLTNSSDNVDWLIANLIPAIQANRPIHIQVDPDLIGEGHVVAANAAYMADLNTITLIANTGATVTTYTIDTSAKTITDSTVELADKNGVLQLTNPFQYTRYITHTIVLFATVSDIISSGNVYGQYDPFYAEYVTWDTLTNDEFTVATTTDENNRFGVHFAPLGTTVSRPYYVFNGHTNGDVTSNVVLIIVVDNRRILTESEYAALGTVTQNDNVLYFVTPDN